MILGRPTNLWLGLVTAITAAIQVSLIALGYDAVVVGTILGAVGGVLGAAILLIANQPPTVNAGDTIKIATPAGQPNAEISATIPPLEAQP